MSYKLILFKAIDPKFTTGDSFEGCSLFSIYDPHLRSQVMELYKLFKTNDFCIYL